MRDPRVARRAIIGRIYRNALLQASPTKCAELDALADSLGEHWMTGNKPTYIDPTQPMTAAEIAIWRDMSIQAVCNHLKKHGIAATEIRKRGRKTYHLRDFQNTPV